MVDANEKWHSGHGRNKLPHFLPGENVKKIHRRFVKDTGRAEYNIFGAAHWPGLV